MSSTPTGSNALPTSSKGLVTCSSNKSSEDLDLFCDALHSAREVNIAEFLENEFKNRRLEIIQPNGFISTPLHVMKTLASDYGTEVHTEIFKINDLTSKSTLWRVEVYIDETFGICVSPRRNLSLQLSAADLLQKVEKNYPTLEMPCYGLVTGSLIKASVHKDLSEYCMKNGFRNPVYKELPMGSTYSTLPMFTICCKVGKKQVTGRSDNRILASRIAAKKMLENISDEKYPNEVVKVGLECGNLESVGKLKSFPEMSHWKTKWMEMYATNTDTKTEKLYSDNVKANSETSQRGDDSTDDEEVWFDAQNDNPDYDDIQVVVLNSD